MFRHTNTRRLVDAVFAKSLDLTGLFYLDGFRALMGLQSPRRFPVWRCNISFTGPAILD